MITFEGGDGIKHPELFEKIYFWKLWFNNNCGNLKIEFYDQDNNLLKMRYLNYEQRYLVISKVDKTSGVSWSRNNYSFYNELLNGLDPDNDILFTGDFRCGDSFMNGNFSGYFGDWNNANISNYTWQQVNTNSNISIDKIIINTITPNNFQFKVYKSSKDDFENQILVFDEPTPLTNEIYDTSENS